MYRRILRRCDQMKTGQKLAVILVHVLDRVPLQSGLHAGVRVNEHRNAHAPKKIVPRLRKYKSKFH